MTEDSVGHPPAGDHGRPALHLGLGALLLAAAWLTASFFLGTSSASAAEPPQPRPPAGLVASMSHTAAALSADLDRAASATLAVPGVQAPAAAQGTRSAAPTPTAARPTAQVPQPAPAIPLVQSAVDALSDIASSVPQEPVETVTDVASGLVSAVAHTTNTVLPVVSRDVLGPVAGTAQEVLGHLATAAPIGHLPGTSAGILPAPPGSERAASEPGAVPAGFGVVLTRHPAAGVLASMGAGIRGMETSLMDPLRASSVPLPALPSPAPNDTPLPAGSDAGAGSAGSAGAAGAHPAADLTRTRFLPPALLLVTTACTSLLPPLSPWYDSDSTPD